MSRPTKLSDLADIANPANALATLRFTAVMVSQFESLRRSSYPGGHSLERGGTIVADETGHLHLQNIGGFGSTRRTFSPDLSIKNPAKFTLVGTFHTHPYDEAEGSYNGVSLSGGDFSHLTLRWYLLSVVQSGPRLFAILRTSATPCIPWTRHAAQTNEIYNRMTRGATFQQASRIESQETAAQFGIAYYQGSHGVLTRV